jgi:uncharacterized protein
MLQPVRARKGSQIAVLIVPTTAPETVEQYALRVGEQWKIGRKKVDDGAILVVAKDDRAAAHRGRLWARGRAERRHRRSRIIREVIVPRFREGDFFWRNQRRVDRMIRVIDGEAATGAGEGGATTRACAAFCPCSSSSPWSPARSCAACWDASSARLPPAAWSAGWRLLVGTLAIALPAAVVAFIFTLMSGVAEARQGATTAAFRAGLVAAADLGGGGGGGFSGGGGSFGGGGASGRW